MFLPKYNLVETKKEGVYTLWPTTGTLTALIFGGAVLALAPLCVEPVLNFAENAYDRHQSKKNLKKKK